MEKLNGLKILVTGGAGFIGSEVVRQLCNQRADVTVLDNFSSGKIKYVDNRSKVVKGDVCDKKVVSQTLKDKEAVIHLAALPFIPDCYYNPKEFFEANLTGTINMFYESLRSKSVENFVHISSSEVYGTAKYTPMDEEHPTFPHSTYAASKLAADRSVFTMHKEHSYPATIVRPFNSYGPNITQPYIVPEIITQLLDQQKYVYLGNTESSRDFTYVSDTAKGIILALTSKKAMGEVINLGSGEDIKIGDLCMLIAKLMQKKVEIKTDHNRFRPYDVDRLICDARKAQKLLNWQPTVSLEDGLKVTLDWIRNNPTQFKEPFKSWNTYYNSRMS